jgi:SPP1 family predicted phage head-tail adaptor
MAGYGGRAVTRNPLVMVPGELRQLVRVQSPDYAADASGAKTLVPATWADVATASARIYTAGGRETSMASQIVSNVSHVVKMRWQGVVVKANYRVIYEGRIFTVQYVEDVEERNRVLLLYCLEVDGGGQ